jgi:hypothetical protein
VSQNASQRGLDILIALRTEITPCSASESQEAQEYRFDTCQRNAQERATEEEDLSLPAGAPYQIWSISLGNADDLSCPLAPHTAPYWKPTLPPFLTAITMKYSL